MKIVSKSGKSAVVRAGLWFVLGAALLDGLALEGVAQNAAAAGGSGPGILQFIMGTLQFAAIGFFVYYMMVILPRNTQENEHKKFITNLKKGDDVVTTGGLIGKVVQVREDSITLELSSSVKVRVLSSHVRSRTSGKPNEETATAKAANTK